MTDEPALMGFIAWVVDGGRHREGARAMLGQCRRSAPDSRSGPTAADPVKKAQGYQGLQCHLLCASAQYDQPRGGPKFCGGVDPGGR
jgi:hypothetical protein